MIRLGMSMGKTMTNSKADSKNHKSQKTEKPVLFVIVSGFNFEEVSTPYYILQEAGFMVDFLSIDGGAPHPDPKYYDKDNEHNNPSSVNRFVHDPEAMYKLQNTLKISDCKGTDFRAVYITGGRGALWDFPGDRDLQSLILDACRQKKLLVSISQGAAAFLKVEEGGEYILKGRKICAATNDEEISAHSQDLPPFMLENRLRARGALFVKGAQWMPNIVEDDIFLTGQNPASAVLLAGAMRDRLLKTAQILAA